uniref:Uncharacterized protein n=1 Tax=Anguilla anguilla TaxID=7936 RepID=A0A0E9PQ91_ANGAN
MDEKKTQETSLILYKNTFLSLTPDPCRYKHRFAGELTIMAYPC